MTLKSVKAGTPIRAATLQHPLLGYRCAVAAEMAANALLAWLPAGRQGARLLRAIAPLCRRSEVRQGDRPTIAA